MSGACSGDGDDVGDDATASGTAGTTGATTTSTTTDPTATGTATEATSTDPTTSTSTTTTTTTSADPTTDPTTSTTTLGETTTTTGDPSTSEVTLTDATTTDGTTTEGTTTDATTTTGGEPICGDGIVEGDEACDDANADNSDDCLDTCALASCGDGIIHVGVEACDNAGDNADGCLESCVIATICDQIFTEVPNAADGVYLVDPDEDGPGDSFEAYCDMTEDAGGWTLVAKVHRWHAGAAYDEPLGWFATERDLPALLDTTSYEDRPAALASHGMARLAPIMGAVTQARITVVAEDDPAQRGTWFKAVDAGVWSWFTATDHPATQVCTDVDMTMDCSMGKIRSTGATNLDGMNLAHFGFPSVNGTCPIHLRHNQDQSPSFSAVCSCTANNNNNAWHDDAADGHWGNGLEIWFR